MVWIGDRWGPHISLRWLLYCYLQKVGCWYWRRRGSESQKKKNSGNTKEHHKRWNRKERRQSRGEGYVVVEEEVVVVVGGVRKVPYKYVKGARVSANHRLTK